MLYIGMLIRSRYLHKICFDFQFLFTVCKHYKSRCTTSNSVDSWCDLRPASNEYVIGLADARITSIHTVFLRHI